MAQNKTTESAVQQLLELTKRWNAHEDVPRSQQIECRQIGERLHAAGGKSAMHSFRMTALIIGGGLAFLVLLMPLVALARGDMTFVTTFLDKYLSMFILIALALLGGGKLFEMFKS